MEPTRELPTVTQPGRMLWSSPNNSSRRRPCADSQDTITAIRLIDIFLTVSMTLYNLAWTVVAFQE